MLLQSVAGQIVASFGGAAAVGYTVQKSAGGGAAGAGAILSPATGVNFSYSAALLAGEVDTLGPVTILFVDVAGTVVAVVNETVIAQAAPSADAIATALLDLANGVEAGLTVRQCHRLLAAVLGGVVTIGGGIATFKGAGVGTNRVAATVPGDGTRPSVVLTL